MSTKHLFPTTDGLVLKSLKGSVQLNPSLALHEPSRTVYVRSPSSNLKVSVISGGGAGHEPAHAGYTAKGMLAASISGDVFASPSAKNILASIKIASSISSSDTGTKGQRDVLVIINNYTGDRLNFGLAMEKARAQFASSGSGERPPRIESIVVADDVSLLNSTSASLVGPRGLGANILVCKVMGALAERGAELDVMKKYGDVVVANLKSIGVGLEHCHVPGRSMDSNGGLGREECEIGMGLHNEPGVSKAKLDAEYLASKMVDMVLGDHLTGPEKDRDGFVRADDECVLFVNNLGGMSQLEMGAMLDSVLTALRITNINPKRVYMSAYMTSLNAPGFSISLLNITSIDQSSILSHSIIDLLDDSTEAFAWSSTSTSATSTTDSTSDDPLADSRTPRSKSKPEDENYNPWQTLDISPSRVKAGIRGACEAVLRCEQEMTKFDSVVGDGDCGETFAAGAKAILKALDDHSVLPVSGQSLAKVVRAISDVLEDSMGGTIGALAAIFFNAYATALLNAGSSSPPRASLGEALNMLGKHTPAKEGDRTIMDALIPFCGSSSTGDLREMARLAREGAERTRGMEPRLGRAVYVGSGGAAGQELPPDPGAWGVAAVIGGYVEGYCGAV